METTDMAEAIAELRQQVRQLESADTEQWTRLDVLRDRLPTWVVWVMTAGGAIIGFLAHWLASCVK
jgi:hypothetical protein